VFARGPDRGEKEMVGKTSFIGPARRVCSPGLQNCGIYFHEEHCYTEELEIFQHFFSFNVPFQIATRSLRQRPKRRTVPTLIQFKNPPKSEINRLIPIEPYPKIMMDFIVGFKDR